MVETTGAKWEGEWMHGKRHGAGTQRSRTGKCRDGIWKKDNFIIWTGSEYFGQASSVLRQAAAAGKRRPGEKIPAAKDAKKDALSRELD